MRKIGGFNFSNEILERILFNYLDPGHHIYHIEYDPIRRRTTIYIEGVTMPETPEGSIPQIVNTEYTWDEN